MRTASFTFTWWWYFSITIEKLNGVIVSRVASRNFSYIFYDIFIAYIPAELCPTGYLSSESGYWKETSIVRTTNS